MQLTTRGIIILLLAAPILGAGTWVPVLRWLAFAYVLICLVLFVLDWWRADSVERFEVSRDHDSKLSLGAENPIYLTLRNLQRRPVGFQLRDEPPDQFVVAHQIYDGRLAPLGIFEQTYYVRPVRRGDYVFGNVNLRWQGPMGLVVRQGHLNTAAPVKVYPNLIEVRRYDLLLKQNRLQELGLRHTRMFGQGTEFERLREYTPDDEYRRINWKATARRQRPVTTEYQTERSQSIIAVLDVGRMMQSPVAEMAKLDYVINAVLLLGYVATGMGDKVGLMTFADEVINSLNPKHGRGQFYSMLEMLYRVEPQPVEPNYRRALSYLALRQRKRALVLIFTDLSGGASMDDLIKHVTLLSKRSLPLVVTISDPDIQQAAEMRPDDSLGVYQQAAAQELLDQRQIALDTLKKHGVLTLDVPANKLSIAVINRYLELKGRMRL